MKAIHSKNKKHKRSFLEIYIARWFATKWRLGFADFEMEGKALYLMKYVNESYDGDVSFHGRISYSKEYSSWFHKVSSFALCGYNNTIVRLKQNFPVPIFFIEGLKKENRLKYLALERLIAKYNFYVSRVIYLRSLKFLSLRQLKQLDFYIERLGVILDNRGS
jgi:hypothetical protein